MSVSSPLVLALMEARIGLIDAAANLPMKSEARAVVMQKMALVNKALDDDSKLFVGPVAFTIAGKTNGNVSIAFDRDLSVVEIGAQHAVQLAEFITARAKDAAKAAGITLVFEEKQ